MAETKKLYETDGMLKECESVVTGYEQIGDRHYITLDQTVFFPEGGGQKADTGTIGESVHVLDGHEKIKGCSLQGPVYEVSATLSVGESVLCKLDWEKRLSRMQQHSGEHILSGLVNRHFGYDNVSFHLSDEEPVIVCFNGALSAEDIARMELLANGAIRSDLPIRVSFPSKDELARMEYRSKKELEGQVRIVTVEGVDTCACCAPHLPTTGRIGLLKVVSHASYKNGGTQLNILCGSRAFELLAKEHEMITELGRDYSASMEKLPNAIRAQRDELQNAKETLARITEEQLLNEIASLAPSDARCIFGEDLTPHSMKICYNALCAKYDSWCAVFSGNDSDGYRFYAGNPKHDSRELAKTMREHLNANGGGSAEMIQGKVQKKKEELEFFFQEKPFT